MERQARPRLLDVKVCSHVNKTRLLLLICISYLDLGI